MVNEDQLRAEQDDERKAEFGGYADFDPVAEQSSDEGKAWIDASAFVQDYGNDKYRVLVWVRGTILNDFEETLSEDGSTRTYPHWLKSRGGKRASREDLNGENFTEQAVRYNTLSQEIRPR